jgi:3-oxoacyl-[acyl-carrier protein] reductase
MPGKLSGQVALITGGSRGIGRAIALLFAAEGADVCINYRRADAEAAAVVKELESRGVRAAALRADITKEGEVNEMVAAAIKGFGKVDILVNDAGVLRTGDVFSLTEKDLDDMFNTNVKGMLFCTRAVGRHMIERKQGKIVNITSNAGLGTAYVGTTGYAATKAAALMLTKRFALEFMGTGVRVNGVAPGYTQTDMTMAGKTQEEFDAGTADVASRALLKRIARPEEIAKAALFLASDDSSFMVGQNMIVDGGRMDYLTHGT